MPQVVFAPVRRKRRKYSIKLQAFVIVTILVGLVSYQMDAIPTVRTENSEKAAVYATMEKCEVRDLSSYNVGRQYSKKLETSMTANNCLSFKCVNNNGNCDNALSTNYNGPNPPCCSHVLRDMARKFDDTMCILGLDYMASFGTLLGFIRSDRIIPWTADNDYAISESTANAMVELWDANTTGLAYMFQDIPRMCVTDTFAEGKLLKWKKKQRSDILWAAGSPYIDFYVAKHKWWSWRQFNIQPTRCYHKPSDMWPAQRIQVYNNTFTQNIPANPEQVLRRIYGKYWRIPDKGENQHGRQPCRPHSP